MSEQLSQAVSDLLNGAANGIGDIAGWVQTDALPQYCAVQSVNHAIWAGIAIAAIVAAAFLARFAMKVLVEDSFTNGEDVIMFYFLFGFIFVVLAGFFAVNLVPAVNWAVNPDGMVLKTLLDSAIR